MKILSAEKIREADAYTIKHEPIKSIDLMERAGGKCFDWLYQVAPNLFSGIFTEEKDWVFYVICGNGNNGGDGMVIARLLQRNGYNAKVFSVRVSDKPSKDFNLSFEKLGKGQKAVVEVTKLSDIPEIPNDAIIIDALFGTGLNRPSEGVGKAIIERINNSESTVVSIDMPSGLFDANNSENNLSGVVKSNYILTFQVPKLSFYLSENSSVVGIVVILDIGLHPDFMQEVYATHNLLTQDEAFAMRKQRRSYSHKGNYGHALIIGGAEGKWGAVVLASKACLRSGAGLVSVHTGGNGANLVHNAMPELMVVSDDSEKHITEVPNLTNYSAIGVGPGMGENEDTVLALKLLIQESKVPLVIDADALNILAENPTWMAFLPKNSILTPHPGEFSRIVGDNLSHFESMEKQRELSQKHQIYILLKGAHSSLSLPDGRVLINSSGNPGMASAGMGDTLTGIITGLLASGYHSLEAAAMGMYIHGRAGDLALRTNSPESLVASDLIENIGNAFNSLSQ